MTVLPEPNDVFIAFKTISLVPGLTRDQRRVFAAILDHFNRNTGRCDPGGARLAKLLGMHLSSVRRATAYLSSEKCGLLEKVSHGGKYRSARYQPVWAKCREFEEKWKRSMKTGESCPNLADNDAGRIVSQPPDTSQSSDLDGRSTETQTLANNQSNKPIFSPSLPPSLLDSEITNLEVLAGQNQYNSASNLSPSERLRMKAKVGALVLNVAYQMSGKRQSICPDISSSTIEKLESQLMTRSEKMYQYCKLVLSDESWRLASEAEINDPGAGLKILYELAGEAQIEKPCDFEPDDSE